MNASSSDVMLSPTSVAAFLGDGLADERDVVADAGDGGTFERSVKD